MFKENESNGVIYHYPNSHLGDYDLESEEAIYHLILKGNKILLVIMVIFYYNDEVFKGEVSMIKNIIGGIAVGNC